MLVDKLISFFLFEIHCRLQLLHFDEDSVGLDTFVTATLYQEVRAEKGATITPFMRQLKLQLFNLALDATCSWFRDYQNTGFTVAMDSGNIKFYPRLLRYDGDQPELVGIVGKTCYLCMANRVLFGDPAVECMDPGTRASDALTANKLRALRHAALYASKKKLCADLGMRHPNVSFRMLSCQHAPFIDAHVGGIPKLIRADELHIVELGLLKKMFEDVQELLPPEALKTVNNTFAALTTPPKSTRLHVAHFVNGPYAIDTPSADEFTSFAVQLPEVIVTVRAQLGEALSSTRNSEAEQLPTVVRQLLKLVLWCRELTIYLRTKVLLSDECVHHIKVLICKIRTHSPMVFGTVREKWNFPKSHTLSAFVRQIRENGIGRCHRGEAAHRYMKERVKYVNRRDDYAAHMLAKNMEMESRNMRAVPRAPKAAQTYVKYEKGFPMSVTEARLQCIVQRTALSSLARTKAVELHHIWQDANIYFVDVVKTQSTIPPLRAGGYDVRGKLQSIDHCTLILYVAPCCFAKRNGSYHEVSRIFILHRAYPRSIT